MSHDEAVWVKRGQHVYFPICLDIYYSRLSLVYPRGQMNLAKMIGAVI